MLSIQAWSHNDPMKTESFSIPRDSRSDFSRRCKLSQIVGASIYLFNAFFSASMANTQALKLTKLLRINDGRFSRAQLLDRSLM